MRGAKPEIKTTRAPLDSLPSGRAEIRQPEDLRDGAEGGGDAVNGWIDLLFFFKKRKNSTDSKALR